MTEENQDPAGGTSASGSGEPRAGVTETSQEAAQLRMLLQQQQEEMRELQEELHQQRQVHWDLLVTGRPGRSTGVRRTRNRLTPQQQPQRRSMEAMDVESGIVMVEAEAEIVAVRSGEEIL